MRFMIIVKASGDSEAGVMPTEDIFKAMADYHEELAKAGVLVDANGLKSSSKGWRIRWSGGKKTLVDGPFTETKELVAGYTIIKTKTREEAVAWSKRFPNPHLEDGDIEVRELFELKDFGDSESIERFREMGVATEK